LLTSKGVSNNVHLQHQKKNRPLRYTKMFPAQHSQLWSASQNQCASGKQSK